MTDQPLGDTFADRHLGPDSAAQSVMLKTLGLSCVEDLLDEAVPQGIRTAREGTLEALDESSVLHELRALASLNTVAVAMIGQGYHGTRTPEVVRRCVLENPAWYTAYTPYQPEISQGRLEALLNFQTVVQDLTGLPVANASLLDEATAAAEAVTLMRRAGRARPEAVLLLDTQVLAQTRAVVLTRCAPLGIEVVDLDLDAAGADPHRAVAEAASGRAVFGALLQYPGADGAVRDLAPLTRALHEAKALVAVAADLLALTVLREPGAFGADVAVGTTQRFGVPMAGGGPHAGYMAVRKGLERSLPGRLVGVSKDADGRPAYRLALQAREQHIRREKATSNICTAQVLLAVMASMYAVHHGPEGLRRIAVRTAAQAWRLAGALRGHGVHVVHGQFFDTVLARVPGAGAAVADAAEAAGVLLRRVDADHVGITCDETTTDTHLHTVLQAFAAAGATEPTDAPTTLAPVPDDVPTALEHATAVPAALHRTGGYLTHPVFHEHRSETSMMRYLRRLADLDYALDRGMIPLGSCTMKLNAATEMAAVTWPEFAQMHPFAPAHHQTGTARLVEQLCRWLVEVTGYAAVSLQPNAGSQGELAGLLAIRAWHASRGQHARTVCLIPASAHGTNAASAVMAGFDVVVVACDDDGGVDLHDLRSRLHEHDGRIGAVMITYPSTHGVFEDTVGTICDLVHAAGGQVYVDGANLNAVVEIARPGEFGADVSHLNLHKTFAIPHGGGGPGVGPVAVAAHLAPFLPSHPLADAPAGPVGPVSGAPHGSAGVLPISWAYLRLMGSHGLRRATAQAVLSANYVAARLRPHYPVLYTGRNGHVAHECILDLRPLTKTTGITVTDVAKRLVDYGFHAPTMSFPVAGTLMVEPTESEDLAELDRFCDAMAAIRAEADQVAAGTWPADDNPLVNAPHTARCLTGDWTHPYSRELAVHPRGVDPRHKYFPPVRRIDDAYGDRNLMCTCPPPEAFTAPGA